MRTAAALVACPRCASGVVRHCTGKDASPTCDLLECLNPFCKAYGRATGGRWVTRE